MANPNGNPGVGWVGGWVGGVRSINFNFGLLEFFLTLLRGIAKKQNSKNASLLWNWKWVQVSLGIFFWKIIPK